jgi:peptide/nickel transport system substrate-binding protein
LDLNTSENSLDDPDQTFYEKYVCGAAHNYSGYCNPELDKLIDAQSMEAGPERRKQLVWGIERKLAKDGTAPVIFYGRFATCWRPQVRGLTPIVTASSTAGAWKTSASINNR